MICQHKVRQRQCENCWEHYFSKKPKQVVTFKDMQDILEAYRIPTHNWMTKEMWKIHPAGFYLDRTEKEYENY